MRVKVFVADYAQVIAGKLVAVGLGFAGLKVPAPYSLVIILELSLDEVEQTADQTFDLTAALVDSDGRAVMSAPPAGGQPEPSHVTIRDVRLTSGTDHPPGSVLQTPLAIGVGRMPLRAGQAYEWRVTINGETDPAWFASFYMAAPG